MSDNVEQLPQRPRRDLIAEMTGSANTGTALIMEGREVPGVAMYDDGDEIRFVIDHRVEFGFPRDQAWNAAAFAFAAMSYGAGCDPLNFEPRPFAKKVMQLDQKD